MHSSLYKFTFILNFGHPFCKQVGFEFLIGIAESFLCRLSALQVKTALMLNTVKLLIVFVGTFTCLKPELFLLILFYSGTF
jgi:hypothetical protein